MSAIIVPLMKWTYAPTENQKWPKHVSCDGAAREMKTRTAWDSNEAGTCQPWWCFSWNGNTHCLRVKSGGKTSAVTVLLMKRNYALPGSQNGEHVSYDDVGYEMEIRTRWGSKEAGTCQPWWCSSWNGNLNTHFLIIENGGKISAMMVPRIKWKYALPDNQKCREQVSLDCSAYEMKIRTRWE